MRDLQARIDAVSADPNSVKAVLKDFLAASLAVQAVVAAQLTDTQLVQSNVGKYVNAVAGYTGVTMDRIRDTEDLTVLARASEIALHLWSVGSRQAIT